MLSAPIEDYRFHASTPTEELMVMCRFLQETGDYASTVLDKAHQTFARKCLAAYRRVEKTLVRREGAAIMNKVFGTPAGPINADNLADLSVDSLEGLYRQRPLRTQARLAEGLSVLTRFYETRIVNELERRIAANPIEQLKIDYCRRTNKDELANIAALLRLPMGSPVFDARKCESPGLLADELERLRRFTTVMEHEALMEYMQYAIDILKNLQDKQQGANLASKLIEIGTHPSIGYPAWVTDYLRDAVQEWEKQPNLPAIHMAIPLLTLYRATSNIKYRRKAQHILNSAYRTLTHNCASNCELCIMNCELCIVNCALTVSLLERCSDYITRYSPRKIAQIKHHIATKRPTVFPNGKRPKKTY